MTLEAGGLEGKRTERESLLLNSSARVFIHSSGIKEFGTVTHTFNPSTWRAVRLISGFKTSSDLLREFQTSPLHGTLSGVKKLQRLDSLFCQMKL